jgi:hypothetical protein
MNQKLHSGGMTVRHIDIHLFNLELSHSEGKDIYCFTWKQSLNLFCFTFVIQRRLCGLAARVPGYRSRDPGFDPRRYQIFWEVVGLERVPLNLVRITEELLEWKSSGSGSIKPGLKAAGICCAYHATPSICAKVGTNFADMRRSFGRYSLLAD